jgi:hypothetical protein
VDTTELLDALAASGLPDDVYVRAAETIRALSARAEAGGELAAAVLRAESYQPAIVMSYVGRFYACDLLVPRSAA